MTDTTTPRAHLPATATTQQTTRPSLPLADPATGSATGPVTTAPPPTGPSAPAANHTTTPVPASATTLVSGFVAAQATPATATGSGPALHDSVADRPNTGHQPAPALVIHPWLTSRRCFAVRPNPYREPG